MLFCWQKKKYNRSIVLDGTQAPIPREPKGVRGLTLRHLSVFGGERAVVGCCARFFPGSYAKGISLSDRYLKFQD